jgi:hypothetical protein
MAKEECWRGGYGVGRGRGEDIRGERGVYLFMVAFREGHEGAVRELRARLAAF